jgi:hypothetical protein
LNLEQAGRLFRQFASQSQSKKNASLDTFKGMLSVVSFQKGRHHLFRRPKELVVLRLKARIGKLNGGAACRLSANKRLTLR